MKKMKEKKTNVSMRELISIRRLQLLVVIKTQERLQLVEITHFQPPETDVRESSELRLHKKRLNTLIRGLKMSVRPIARREDKVVLILRLIRKIMSLSL